MSLHYISCRNKIDVDDVTYKGTPGLWALLMLKAPTSEMYTEEELNSYAELAEQTGILSRSQPYTSNKAKALKELLGIETPPPPNKKRRKKVGTGIVYLPGDIKGLTTRLQLLLAEFDSGNRTSTRNEIVSILDELKRRNRISTEKYKEINNHLAATL